jgi:hypothetical protein
VEPRATQGAAKGPFYRSAWRVEASGGGRPAVEFNSASFEE